MSFINKSELRDPFFEIRVGPPNAKPNQMITLPTWIHRLIPSFDYSLSRNGGNDSAARIKFNIFETLNRPGSILDLKLDINNLSFKDPTEIKEGKVQVDKKDQEKDVKDDKEFENLSKKVSDKKAQKRIEEEKKITNRYLFQEHNVIEVIFGYRNVTNPLLESRLVRGAILQITHRSPEQNISVTEIVAVDVGTGEHSKLTPVTGINFSRGKVKELLNGNLLDKSDRPDTAPARVDDIIRAIASSFENTEANVLLPEDQLKADIQDKHSCRSFPMGTNVHVFLRSLAEKLSAHYWAGYVIKNGKIKTVLNLVSREYYEAKYRFHFMWKSGLGSAGIKSKKSNSLIFNTLLDYELQLYPTGGSGGSSAGVDSNNKKEDSSTAAQKIQFTKQGASDSTDIEVTPEKTLVVKTTEWLTNTSLNTSKGEYHPTDDTKNHEIAANTNAARQSANLRLSFNSIGIPQLSPEVILLSNVGERYSGPYYLLSVTHTFTADGGYVCSAVGEANTIAAGGVKIPASPSVPNNPAARAVHLGAVVGAISGTKDIEVTDTPKKDINPNETF